MIRLVTAWPIATSHSFASTGCRCDYSHYGQAAILRFQLVIMFKADHQLLFLIQHNPSGAILYLERVMNPSK